MPLTLLALLVELMLGYPDALVRAVGHPVTWMGRLIGALDRHLNRDEDAPARRRIAGGLALLVLIIVVGGIAWLIAHSLLRLSFGLVILAVIASTLLAQRSLYAHVARVAAALERDGLAAARTAVAQIVGRDPEALDEAGVARAAIESLAENFSDGVVAPALWMAVGGLPGAAVYKAINTADSMIGHRTERHADFGCAAAQLDDLVNLPASRLAALLIVAAAALGDIRSGRAKSFGPHPEEPAEGGRLEGWQQAEASSGPSFETRGPSGRAPQDEVADIFKRVSARAAWGAVVRDAPRHRSPNAGYPEAAMAGALGLALAGPRRYGGVVVEDAVIGDGRREASAADIRAALTLYRRADALLIGLVAVVTAIVIATG